MWIFDNILKLQQEEDNDEVLEKDAQDTSAVQKKADQYEPPLIKFSFEKERL
jgi:hypothetical protein